MKRFLVLPVIAALAVGLASCAAEQTPPPASREPAPQAGAQPTEPDIGDDTTQPSRPKPPLTQFMDEIYGLDLSEQERTEKEQREHAQIEDVVASCMKQEGFEYTPAPFVPSKVKPGVSVDGVSDDDVYDREWVTRYGYGVVETPDRPMDRHIDQIQKVEAPADPNSSYVNGLSAGQRDAYYTTLFGTSVGGGCAADALLEVGVATQLDELDEHRPFFEAVDAFYNEAGSWAGLSDLQAAWSSCMSDKGQPGLQRTSAAIGQITAEYVSVWEAAGYDGVPFNAGQISAPIDALKVLSTKERDLALTDLDCREQVDYRATYDDIALREEERFMADHKAAADALRAAADQSVNR